MSVYLGVAMGIIVTVCSLALAAEDVSENEKPVSRVVEAQLHLDEYTQQLAGINVITVTQTTHTDEIIAYGHALFLPAMLSLHQRYLVNNTEQQRLAAQLAQATQALKRAQALYQEGVMALRSRQEHYTQWQSANAQYEQTLLAHDALVAEAKITWGDSISAWLLAEKAPQLAQLLAAETCLLQINVSTNAPYTEPNPHIQVSVAGKREYSQSADYISSAPQVEIAQQGVNYFYQTNGKYIKPGMKITAWLPRSKDTKTGVVVPKSALIWYLGQSFVYLKTSNESFMRHLINDYSVVAEGVFIDHRILSPGAQVVITGGQLLLSEEMRSHLPNEDDED
jgi:hypothetical protein